LTPSVQDGSPRSILLTFTKFFWIFLSAENLYDTGIYIFVLLYNLYLLDLGYREDFLGWVTAAMSAGSIIGSLPAAAIVHRLGLKRTLICSSAGVALLCMGRTASLGGAWLIATAFAAGVISAIWAVSLVPVVAALTTDRNRPLGYSLWCGWGIGLGVLCGVLAGALPGWILKWDLAASPTAAKRLALLFGAAVALFSPILLVRLPLGGRAATGPKIFPRSPFVVRYLVVSTVWNIGVGVFNPFFSAYFARQLHLSVERIGFIFSASQLAQLGALMAAPLVLKRFGVVSGTSMMQAGVALSLALLSTGPSAAIAGIVYAMYGSFQYMSEPGVFTLLMSRVEPAERAGVSSLNFFVMSASQAAAAAIAGTAVVRFGYQPVLIFAAVTTALSAYLFRRLLQEFNRP
jgi:MFS family permease